MRARESESLKKEAKKSSNIAVGVGELAALLSRKSMASESGRALKLKFQI